MIIADHQILSRLNQEVRWKGEHQRFHSRTLEVRHGITAKILRSARRNTCIARRQEKFEPFVGSAYVTACPHHLVENGESETLRNPQKEESSGDAGNVETEMHAPIKPQENKRREATFDPSEE